MKKYLFLILAPLLFILLSLTNAVAERDIVLIRIYKAGERNSSLMAKIIVVENGKTREIELAHGFESPQANKNSEAIASVLNQYDKAGFKVVNSSAVPIGQNNSHIVTTYVLTK